MNTIKNTNVLSTEECRSALQEQDCNELKIEVSRVPVVQLQKLSDETINRIRSGFGYLLDTQKEVTLLPEKVSHEFFNKVENVVTKWVIKKAKKNIACNKKPMSKQKVIRKTKYIVKVLKAKTYGKYKNANYMISDEWFDCFKAKAKWSQPYLYSLLNKCSSNGSKENYAVNSYKCKRKLMKDHSVWKEKGHSQIVADLLEERMRDINWVMPAHTSGESLDCVQNRVDSECDNPRVCDLSDAASFNYVNLENIRCSTPLTSVSEASVHGSDKTILRSDVPIDLCSLTEIKTEELNLSSQDTLIPTEEVTMPLHSANVESQILPSSEQDCCDQIVNSQNEPARNDPLLHIPDVLQPKLGNILQRNTFLPQQIFVVNETVLFWKKMLPGCVLENEPGANIPEGKDPLTVLLGSNVSGDCKFEPMVVYSVENPSSLKSVIKTSLPVIWKFHPKAKMTAFLFEDWITYSFIPMVQMYCSENKVPFSIILILNEVPWHRRVLEYAHPNVKVVFSKLIDTDNGMCGLFKGNYVKRLVERIVECAELDQMCPNTFWKSFNLLHALKLISVAWDDVSKTDLIVTWGKIGLIDLSAMDVYDPLSNTVEHVINLADRLQWNVSEAAVKTLISSPYDELISKLCFLERQNKIDDEDESSLNTLKYEKLLDAFKLLQSAMNIFETEDPNFKRSSYVVENIKNSYKCYREIYLERKKRKLSVLPSISADSA